MDINIHDFPSSITFCENVTAIKNILIIYDQMSYMRSLSYVYTHKPQSEYFKHKDNRNNWKITERDGSMIQTYTMCIACTTMAVLV